MTTARRDPLLAQRRPDRLHPPRLPAACCGAGPARAAQHRPDELDAPATRRRTCRRVSLIVPAYDEEEVIAAKVANALALDYPRERLQIDRRLRRLHRRHRRARPRRRRRPRPRAAARRQGRRPERRRRAGRRRDPRLLRRQQRLGAATRCAASSPPSPTPRVGYVCGQVRFLDPERRQPRGRLLALRDGGARDGVGAGRRHRRQRRDLRGAPRRLHPARPLRQPRPQLPLPPRQARPALALRARRPAPRRRWCRRSRASSPANGG